MLCCYYDSFLLFKWSVTINGRNRLTPKIYMFKMALSCFPWTNSYNTYRLFLKKHKSIHLFKKEVQCVCEILLHLEIYVRKNNTEMKNILSFYGVHCVFAWAAICMADRDMFIVTKASSNRIACAE